MIIARAGRWSSSARAIIMRGAIARPRNAREPPESP